MGTATHCCRCPTCTCTGIPKGITTMRPMRGSRSTASTRPRSPTRPSSSRRTAASREVAPFMSYGEFTGHAPQDTCSFWPVPPTTQPHEISVKGLPPILVVSTTNDPATPYEAGVDLAKQLGGTLVTFDGHTAHRCLPGQQVHRRHRRHVPDRRDGPAAGHPLLINGSRLLSTPRSLNGHRPIAAALRPMMRVRR